MGANVINNTLNVKKDLVVSGEIKGTYNDLDVPSVNISTGVVNIQSSQLRLTSGSATEMLSMGTSAFNISSSGDLTFCAGLNNATGSNDTMFFGTRANGGGGSYYEMRLQDGMVSIGDNFTPTNTLHLRNVDGSTKEILRLEQLDDDEPFVLFTGTTASDQTKSLSTDTSVGALEGHILVSINGADKWIPYYAKN
jgi:hypothetical protein